MDYLFEVNREIDGRYHAWLTTDYPRDNKGWGSDPFSAIADLCDWLAQEPFVDAPDAE